MHLLQYRGPLAVGLGILAALAPPARAQRPTPPGTLLVAHGGGIAWNDLVRTVAAKVNTGGPVEVSFLMGPEAATHRFQDAVRRLAERGALGVVVVPLLISSHSGHYEQIRYLVGETDSLDATMHHHLAMAGIERPPAGIPVVLTQALDAAEEVTAVLVERALALATAPDSQALFVIGHGPSTPDEYAQWMVNVRRLGERVRLAAGFRDVKTGLLWDDSPPPVRAEAVARIREIIALQHELTRRPVVVVLLLMSRGRVSDEKIPVDLEGLAVAYSGEALLPHPAVARWVEARVREALPQLAAGGGR